MRQIKVKISRLNNYKNTAEHNNAGKNSRNSRNFKGGVSDFVFNTIDKAFCVLDKDPMIQVSFVDTVSTNIPRTLVDLKTGLAASLETCRREFSGLFVNCIMPGMIVKGIAYTMQQLIKLSGLNLLGFKLPASSLKGTNPAASYANGDTIDKLKEIYKQAYNSGAPNVSEEYARRALKSLRGLNGTEWVEYASKADCPAFKSAVLDTAAAISQTGSRREMLLKRAQGRLAELFKAENILQFRDAEEISGIKSAHAGLKSKSLISASVSAGEWKPQADLQQTLRDIADMGGKFNIVKNKAAGTSGSLTSKELSKAIENYGGSLKKFVNTKSILGLLITLGIAVSVQTWNRAITRKQFKAEGAPIYKDFGIKDTSRKMNEKEKKKFFIQKLASAVGMYGLAALSMMKKPSLGMFQFSGFFPTLDQCRWVAASTFASRMMGAEDENELRETTVRDLASFAGLYFLGDYAKKGAASAIEAFSGTKAGRRLIGEKAVLLNRKKEVIKPAVSSFTEQISYRFKQFGNWIKNTELKTAAEVSNIKMRNLRNICRIADIAFSVVMLGILLPKYNRRVTERKVEEAKRLEAQRRKAALDFSAAQKRNTPEIFKNIA